MKILDYDYVRQLPVTPLQIYNWVEEMLYNKDKVILPPKISMKMPNHSFYNVMPCIIPDSNVMGVKVITRLPSRGEDTPSLTSQIILYDLMSGNLKALVDGNYITAMRTGSVAAHSLKLFARNNFKSIGIIGLGITATATFDIITHLYPEREMLIKLYRYKNQAEQFISRYNNYNNLRFSIEDNIEDIISNSDIIISCVTYTEDNFASDEFYKEGCTVIPVHTRGFQNCDLFFDKVYGDDTGHVEGFRYFKQFKQFAEVSDVLLGKKKGRENDSERILVYNIGLAMHDVYIANKYYLVATDAKDLDFTQPTKKMWL